MKTNIYNEFYIHNQNTLILMVCSNSNKTTTCFSNGWEPVCLFRTSENLGTIFLFNLGMISMYLSGTQLQNNGIILII